VYFIDLYFVLVACLSLSFSTEKRGFNNSKFPETRREITADLVNGVIKAIIGVSRETVTLTYSPNNIKIIYWHY
jgi:hypothetical protein